jgi:arylsulfatase A-like enzyme
MSTFLFKRLPAVLGVLLVFAFSARADMGLTFTNAHARVAVARRPSIIFIQCHGLGFGDLSCYGQTNFQTPNLDKLAAGGMLFNHYTPGDTNMAAVQAALFTGRTSNSSADDGVTVAQVLKNAGYRTCLIGEWPLPGKPWKEGFDEFAGFLNPDEGTNYYADFVFHYDPRYYLDPVNNVWTLWRPGDGPNEGAREMIYQNTAGQKGRYMPDFMLGGAGENINGWAENFIQNYQPDKYNLYRPLFLMVNLSAPRSAEPGTDNFPVPTDAPYSDEPWPQAAKNRAAMITRLDGDIGRLFQQLDQLGMTDNVVIFFTSSSVPEKFANPQLNFFRTPADRQSEGTNGWTAPMIVYWPGSIPAGRTSDSTWSPKDFLPTAAQIGYLKPPDNIDGHSILPILVGKETASRP